MTGGTFTSQNKVRPGFYANFKSVPAPISKIGTRGIMTMPVPLDWGDTIIELLSTDLLNGKSLAKIGYTAFDDEAQIFREALRGCYKAIIYRADTGGVKASVTVAPLTAIAKYAGILGNKVSIAVIANGTKFDVVTFFKGVEKNRQTVATISQLVDNDYVAFSGTGASAPTVTAGTSLTDGANGTVTPSVAYPAYLAAITKKKFNTLALPTTDTTQNQNFVAFIRDLRENQGKKVQAVLYKTPSDYEGIISVKQGYGRDTNDDGVVDETISAATFVATVAGLTAGAEINESLTNTIIDGAITIIDNDDDDEDEEIIGDLNKGYLLLSFRSDGETVKIEQDLNSFISITADKNYTFRKNRPLRVLDQINNDLNGVWETSYMGKADNDVSGRNVYKGDVVHYMGKLQDMHAIKNFNAATDIEISEGDDVDAVVTGLWVQPVDSMEKMYLTVNVGAKS